MSTYTIEYTSLDDLRATATIEARDAEEAEELLCDTLGCAVAIHSVRRAVGG